MAGSASSCYTYLLIWHFHLAYRPRRARPPPGAASLLVSYVVCLPMATGNHVGHGICIPFRFAFPFAECEPGRRRHDARPGTHERGQHTILKQYGTQTTERTPPKYFSN